jgi:hypothetical protein
MMGLRNALLDTLHTTTTGTDLNEEWAGDGSEDVNESGN